MQLKNNAKCNQQFFFHKKVGKTTQLELVHIPGGATVELDDDIFEAICQSTTSVEELELREIPLDTEQTGAEIKSGKEVLTIKEYFPTGKRKTVSLVKELIKQGQLVVVERPKDVSMTEVDAFLNKQGISVKDMPEDAKLALYDKLA